MSAHNIEKLEAERDEAQKLAYAYREVLDTIMDHLDIPAIEDIKLIADDVYLVVEERNELLEELAAEKARADKAEAERDALREVVDLLRTDDVMNEIQRSEEYWLEAYEGTQPDFDMCAHGRFTRLHDLTTAIAKLDAGKGTCRE
jgi:hypothetical protein